MNAHDHLATDDLAYEYDTLERYRPARLSDGNIELWGDRSCNRIIGSCILCVQGAT